MAQPESEDTNDAGGQPMHTRPSPDVATIRAYYDETLAHYRLVWFSRETRAMHFGLWDETTVDHAQSLANMNRRVARLVGIHARQRILDAGCGFGDSAIWLARTCDVDVVGITIVPGQVDAARAFAGEQGVAGRVTFELQDYTRTTFGDSSFDVIWAMESICHAPDKRFFLEEAYRLLRPEGRLGVVEYMRTETPPGPLGEPLMRAFCDGWAMPNLAYATEWCRWATEIGFVDATLTDLTDHTAPSFRRLYRAAVLTWPFAGFLRALHISTERQYANKLAVLAGYRALRLGLWREQVLTATKPG